MSKKDYIALARALFESREEARKALAQRPVDVMTWNTWSQHITVQKIADVLAAGSPRFDRARFVEACETGTTKGMPKRAA